MTSTEQLLRIYHNNLNEKEKLVLRTFSYCSEPLSVHKTWKVLLANKITESEIAKCYKSLLNAGLIQTKTSEAIINKSVALTILVDALKDASFVKTTIFIWAVESSSYDRTKTTPYKKLRQLVEEHYKNNSPQDYMINAAREVVTHYYDYLEPVAGEAEFNWLFSTLGSKCLYEMINSELLDIHADLRSMKNIAGFDERLRNIPGLLGSGLSSNLVQANYHLLDGNFKQMETYTRMIPEKYQDSLLPEGIHALYGNNVAKAYKVMHATMASQNKTEMFVNYEIFYAVYYILSLLGLDTRKYTPEAQKMLAKDTGTCYTNIIASAMLNHALCRSKEAEDAMARADFLSSSASSLDQIFLFVAACYTESKLDGKYLPAGSALFETAINNGYKLLALELAFALAKIYQSRKFEEHYAALVDELKLVSVLASKQHIESWEMALNNLLGVVSTVTPGAKSDNEKPTRVVYFIAPDSGIVQPTLQTATVNGGWSKGRSISLKALKAMDVTGMTDQDRRIAATIEVSDQRSYVKDNEYYFSDEVWSALAGHPYLFMSSNPEISIEMIKSQPTVTVEETVKGYVLKADINPGGEKFILHKESGTRYKLIDIDNQQRAILQAINKGEMVIPLEGKEKLVQALDGMANFFTIHTDLAETKLVTRTVEVDSRIRIQLVPLGNTIKAEFFVKPFGTALPYCKPGEGGKNIIGMVGGERCCVNRDLKMEARYAEAILQEIRQGTDIDTTREPVIFDDPRDCLYLLDILSKHRDIALVEWPEGARFKVNRSVSMSNLNLEVKGIDYWFEVDGNLKVDENTVLSLGKLLELNARSHGRFIELGDGEFLALSNDLKKRLDELNTFTSEAGEHIKMNRFASIALMEVFGQAGSFKGDSKWADFREQLAKVEDVRPKVPKTLQAELRPYQEEGFQWMVRLSEWGAGACLADDMGLGKTVQALALLLHRAKKGPALVVCPASVVPNWVSETNRFAPTLNTVLLTQANRRETLEKAKALDLVITTYGLLQSEEELFAREKWATVILDEAHAIKNYNTKTSKAAMSLDAEFRLAMTGTPVQNHLGEVWNLFHFINPGLLGTMQRFNDRFVKTGDIGSKRLKKLVTPFILRRTKNNVLEELPPKTEIVKQVELTDDERVFYEAIRRQAIDNLQHATGPAGQQHVKALAEITRLRLACCNPALVEPDIKISSSKLATFVEIVDELLGNNHRALVFSQFVKHLNIIRRELDEKKIHYKYLDGATTLAERERNVREFQAGDGELFLISLKAGGLGLNLTAADYVIHLDPWWNPAIEDQASDRAHRIGQKRPITIYRLVSQHTIEEKIIQLHHTKRNIADALLEGSDAPGKLSTEELLKLIMEE